MDGAMNTPDVAYLLSVAGGAIVMLLVLIMRFKVHAFVALTLVSMLTALATGVTYDQVIPTMLTGFGGTLASVALLVGLGAMIGRILEMTGGAKVLADTLINRFGSHRAPFALGVASLLFGFPIFFDAGLIVMLPIIFSVAKQFGGSVLKYALPSAGAFAVMHAFLPPHPGPVAASELLGANIGLLTIVGLLVALPTWYLGAYLFGLWSGKKFELPLPPSFTASAEQLSDKAPSFGQVISILLLPLVLIFMDTGLNTLSVMGVIDKGADWVNVLRMVGKTPVALLITVLYALWMFRQSQGKVQLEKFCNDALAPVCAVILVTGADAARPQYAALMAPTVAATTGLSELDLTFIVIAIAGGATVLSHFNDSGFWLVSRFLNMDEKTTLKTWTVMETLLGTIAFLIVATASAIL